MTALLMGIAVFALPYNLIFALERYTKRESPIFTPAMCGWIAAGLFSLILGILKIVQDKAPEKHDCFYRANALQIGLENAVLAFADTIPTMTNEMAKTLHLKPGILRIPEYESQVFQIPSTGSERSTQSVKGLRHLPTSRCFTEDRLLASDPKHNSQKESSNIRYKTQKISIPQCSVTTLSSKLYQRTKTIKIRPESSVPPNYRLCNESLFSQAAMKKKPQEEQEKSAQSDPKLYVSSSPAPYLTTGFNDFSTSEKISSKAQKIHRVPSSCTGTLALCDKILSKAPGIPGTSLATSGFVQRYPPPSKSFAINLQSRKEEETFLPMLNPLEEVQVSLSPVEAEAGSMA